VSLTCFKHPIVHPQGNLYTQLYGISFMHPYKQSLMPVTRMLIWMH